MKLSYFDIYGRAESIRMLLSHAKVEYENATVNGEQVAALKAEGALEFGQVPLFEKDGKRYAQSWSILRFVGSQYGYYPTDAELAYRIDSSIDGVEAFLVQYFRAVFERDAEKKQTLLDDFLKFLPKYLNAFTDRLNANESQLHAVGTSFTIADFAIAAAAFNVLNNEAAPFYAQTSEVAKKEDYPVLYAYITNLGSELQGHLTSRPVRPY